MKKIIITLMVLLSITAFGKRKREVPIKEIADFCHLVATVVFPKEQDKYYKLFIETLAVESDLGLMKPSYRDGIAQMTRQGSWYAKKGRSELLDYRIKLAFNIDMNKVKFEDNRKDYRISILNMALYYKGRMKPDDINKMSNAQIWKKYYNTKAGKGTISNFYTKSKLYKEYTEEYALVDTDYYAVLEDVPEEKKLDVVETDALTLGGVEFKLDWTYTVRIEVTDKGIEAIRKTVKNNGIITLNYI